MSVVVNIRVENSDIVPAPIPGVVVGVLDTVSYSLLAQVTSDSSGIAGFLLDPGEYEVRAYKVGVLFDVARIIVPASASSFTLRGTVLSLPVSTDPRTCMCTGRFVDISNRPMPYVAVRFLQKQEAHEKTPKVVDGALVPTSSTSRTTDSAGKLSVELIRTGRYYVQVVGEEDHIWEILVPDRSSVNLIDLVHPQPVLLQWDQTDVPGNALALAIGEEKIVRYTVTFSDYETLSTGIYARWLTVTNSDETIAVGLVGDGSISITGKAVGSSTVTASVPVGTLPRIIPSYNMAVTPIQVTVS